MVVVVVLGLVVVVSFMLACVVTSDQGIVIGVEEPLIDGITVVKSTGLKLLELAVKPATNSSAGDKVTFDDIGVGLGVACSDGTSFVFAAIDEDDSIELAEVDETSTGAEVTPSVSNDDVEVSLGPTEAVDATSIDVGEVSRGVEVVLDDLNVSDGDETSG